MAAFEHIDIAIDESTGINLMYRRHRLVNAGIFGAHLTRNTPQRLAFTYPVLLITCS